MTSEVTADSIINDEINPSTITGEQVSQRVDTSTTNGISHANGTNNAGTSETTTTITSAAQQIESSSPSKNDSDQNYNDSDPTYNKNELEPESLRKVFIGGLSYKTDDQVFRDYFSKFGDIVDCIIMRDRDGRSRGFGFITYSSSTMVDRLMASRPHVLDSREIEPKRAIPREESGKPEASISAKKLFVGGIREGTLNENDLNEYFSKYGNIIDAVIMKTNEGKLRGFGFVEFDDYDPVDKIVLEKHHVINGNAVNVEKALPKDQTNRNRLPQSGYGGAGGGGGGGGGGGMRGPPGRMSGGWGPMGAEANFGSGYRSGGGGYGAGGDYGRPSPYGGYPGEMGGMMGFGGSAPMGGGGYGMGPARGNYDDGFGAFGPPSGFGFGQGYGSSPGGGAMRRGGGAGGGRGGGAGAPYSRGGGRGGGFRGRN